MNEKYYESPQQIAFKNQPYDDPFALERRILVVEDNPINQKVIYTVLKNHGCHVDVVSDGEQALAVLDLFRYSLIFMDMQMPVMDGLTATKQIRSSSRANRHTPIVAMTANAMNRDRVRCLESGMNDYVAKPFSRQTIVQILDTWLGEISIEEAGHTEHAQIISHEKQQTVFEKDKLLQRFSGDMKLATSIVSEFLASEETMMSSLQSLLQTKNVPEAVRYVHDLKSVSSMLGCDVLADVCRTTEMTMRETNQIDPFIASRHVLQEQIVAATTILRDAFPSE